MVASAIPASAFTEFVAGTRAMVKPTGIIEFNQFIQSSGSTTHKFDIAFADIAGIDGGPLVNG
jgi:hypothetical protein